MSQKDYYAVLGVAEDADPAAIKKAHRTLAKRYHPDRNRDQPEAEARFKEIQEAYDVLSDPEKRKKYDHLRRFGAGGFDPGDGGVNLEDLFGAGGGGGFGGSIFDLFERAGMGRGRGSRGPRRGEDVASRMAVPFDTAAFGGEVTIRVPRTEGCGSCGGSGAAAGAGAKPCPACGGAGTTAAAQGAFSFSRPCPRCYGRGTVIEIPCPACAGRGSRTTDRELKVKIPAGIADGGKIRLRGEGEPGQAGAPSGDLILTVGVSGHQGFERKGLNVTSEVEIGLAEAALGVTREVDTLRGTVELQIPAGVQPGAKLRLKDRGVRDHRGRTGDHFVRLKVRVPKDLTERQRELLEEFAAIEESQ